jgi:pilus assembly protein CpaB
MNQNAGALKPSRGNTRFIALAFVLGLLGAGLVYLAASRDSSTGSTSSTTTVPVVVAKVEIPARTAITASMVEVKRVPEGSASLTALGSVADAQGRVTRFPIAVGEQVLPTKLVDLGVDAPGISRSLSFVIPEGKRGFAITASEVQNVGGLVLPGDYVDIVVIHDVEFQNGEGEEEVVESYLVQTLMQNVEVLAVSQTVVDVVEASIGGAGTEDAAAPADGAAEDTEEGSSQRVRNSEARPNPEAATVTVAVTPEEAERLYLAEANGRIRLSVRPFGDAETLPIDYQTKVELIPQDLPNPFEALR